jgi:hypothetical protein
VKAEDDEREVKIEDHDRPTVAMEPSFLQSRWPTTGSCVMTPRSIENQTAQNGIERWESGSCNFVPKRATLAMRK